MRKSTFPLALIIGLAFTQISEALYAQLSLSAPDTVSAKREEQVSIPLNLANPDSVQVDAFSLIFFYPATLLTFQHTDNTGTLTENWLQTNGQENTPGEITIGGFDLSATTASGALINIVFQVNASAIGSDTLKVRNLGDDLTNATTIDGLFIVINIPPVITAIPDTTVNEDELFQLQVQAGDEDNDPLTYALVQNPNWLEIDASTGLLSGRPEQKDVGTHSVEVEASDGRGGRASTSFTIVVKNVNDAPQAFSLLLPPDGVVIDTLNPTLIWRRARDEDTGDEVRYDLIISSKADFSDSLLFIADLVDTTFTVFHLLSRSQTYFWKIFARDLAGAATGSDAAYSFTTSGTATAIDGRKAGAMPAQFGLLQNYPNPFNSATRIKFQLPGASKVRLVLFNLAGQSVMTIFDGSMPAGFHEIQFDGLNSTGTQLASGIYVFVLKAGGISQTRRMVLVR